jgi:hypothetical protein
MTNLYFLASVAVVVFVGTVLILTYQSVSVCTDSLVTECAMMFLGSKTKKATSMTRQNTEW